MTSRCFDEQSDAAFKVFSNQLSNIMKTVVLTIRKEKEQTEFVKQWEKSWQDGLFRALTSKDR